MTAAAGSIDLSPIAGLKIARRDSARSTAFHNRYDRQHRLQRLLSRADDLGLGDVPAEWRHTAVVHLAPIAREIDLELCASFPDSFVGLSAQGLLRNWDTEGQVTAAPWADCLQLLTAVDAVVVSLEDLASDWQSAERLAPHCRLLVVTEAEHGARYYADGEWQRVPGIATEQVDPTGAGDVFAAIFFSRFARLGDPAIAAQAANRLAAASVTRPGLSGVPSAAEVLAALQPVEM